MMRAQFATEEIRRRFALFASAGVVGTATHYAALVTLVEVASLPAARAAAAGAAIGATVNYALNYKFTFQSKARHTSTAPRFALIAGLGMLLSWAVVSLAVMVGLHYLLGQVLATILVLVAGFLANHFWTFSGATDDPKRT